MAATASACVCQLADGVASATLRIDESIFVTIKDADDRAIAITAVATAMAAFLGTADALSYAAEATDDHFSVIVRLPPGTPVLDTALAAIRSVSTFRVWKVWVQTDDPDFVGICASFWKAREAYKTTLQSVAIFQIVVEPPTTSAPSAISARRSTKRRVE